MKRCLAILLTLALVVGAVPAGLAAERGAPAAKEAAGYYGSRLTDPVAIAFYQALERMDFASNGNLPVTDPAVIEEAEAYAGGNDTLIRRFGAAVDSFRYDHTELFYVDWDMLSVNVGRKSGRFVVNIGTGRTDSYLRDKTADIAAQTAAYEAALEQMAADVEAKAGANPSVKDLAKAANDAVCQAVTYDFCDGADGKATEASKYIRTAYGALVGGRAVCEGYSRLYKAVLNALGVNCELVSGYFLEGESFEPHMWNYVQDEEDNWYAVDVTMNDGHRLHAAGGVETEFEKYFWQSEELFAIDHLEDGKVSSVEYEMPYPELYRFWKSPTESGRLQYGIKTYEGSPAFWFSFDGKSAEELQEEDGLYMALRAATTNTGTLVWTPWQSVQEYNRLIPGIAPSVGHETYFRGQNIAMPILEVGVFDIAEDEAYSEFSRTYSEEAVTTHLIETVGVENPSHDPDYIAPAYVVRTEPKELFQRRQNVLETRHVELEYDMPLRELEGGMELTWDVSSYNNRDLSLEAVQKNAKLENVAFDGDRTISFDFTPSRAYNHNMIFYNFTVHNMVNVLPDGRDGVALRGFSILYEYKDSIACCKIYNDGRLYVNSYAQPTIAMNGDLSMTGWEYEDVDEDGNPVTKKVSESQRSQLALVVTRPQNSEELTEKAADQVSGGEGAIAASTTYEIDLNLCGKLLQIPNGSYMKLNLGIPDAFIDLVGEEEITFKLYHFKRDEATGELDYENPEVIDCVLTPYGLIATVTSFSPYVLMAIDNSKLPAEERETAKGIALLCNGHGGKAEGTIPAAGTLEEGDTVTYTLTPDEGYEVEFAVLNGASVPVVSNTITLTYEMLESSNTLEVGFVATAVKEAEAEEGVGNVNPGAACTKTEGCVLASGHEGPCVVMYTVTFNSNGGSAVADAFVEGGKTVEEPEKPTKDGHSFEGWYEDEGLTRLYDFSTPVTADRTLYAKWTPQSGSGSGTVSRPSRCTLTYESNGGTKFDSEQYPYGTVVKLTNTPVKENARFCGWFSDKELTVPVTEVTLRGNMTVYAKWGSLVIPSLLGGDTHKAYLFGKSDGLIHPNDQITRAEAATILYRLLSEDARAGASGKDLPFTDTPKGSWYYDAVAALYALDIIHGRTADAFAPEATITRAEFMKMCANLIEELPEDAKKVSFTDMEGHWAKESVEKTAALGWINGDGSGRFMPNENLTRAQAVAVTNRILGRSLSRVDELGEDMKTWEDNMDPNAWYYLDIQAAGNDC